MLIGRIHLLFDIPFRDIKKNFNDYIQTEIYPNMYIYCNNLFFLTINDRKDSTIFTIEDESISFPISKLDISNIPLDTITHNLIPDKFVIDLGDVAKLDYWEKKNNYLERDIEGSDFKLFKRKENDISFYSISSKNNFLNYKEFIDRLERSFLA